MTTTRDELLEARRKLTEQKRAVNAALNGIAPNGSIVTTMEQAAEKLGVVKSTVCKWIKDGCPGKHGFYDTDKMRAWREGIVESGVDPMDAPVLSPGLERYRQMRANLAELEYHERIGTLCTREAVRDLLARFFAHAERAKARIVELAGEAGEQVANDMLTNMRRVLADLGEGGARGGSTNGNGNGNGHREVCGAEPTAVRRGTRANRPRVAADRAADR